MPISDSGIALFSAPAPMCNPVHNKNSRRDLLPVSIRREFIADAENYMRPLKSADTPLACMHVDENSFSKFSALHFILTER